MKMRYKPPYTDEVVSFNPSSEIICPLCGDVKPVPYGWKTHTTFISCNRNEHHSTKPKYYHSSLFTDINHFIDDDDPQLTAYRISIGELYEEDVREWLNKRTMWLTMFSVGGVPKWKIEPEPFWRARIKRDLGQAEVAKGG